ncbi:MAG: imidazole glycerol-phosphate synthase subunit HisF [Synergistaceae bacterium]|jgi:cyclase|nr:imidazole glycerol-phosphate synthase subunit HisF [Synergistaceae bacterium]MDI3531662.1 imidazole glycerol-phosphate synthase subunit HisF [Synergistaceae bacterium]
MLMRRIIPCLDVKDGRVVKGIHFKSLRDAGDPAELASIYMDEGADELTFLDISASLEGVRTRHQWVQSVAERLFVPFTVGGGISSADEARELIALGADKISINTKAVAEPELITKCARLLGSQAVVVAIDAKRRPSGGWEVYVKGGTEPTGLDVVAWASAAVSKGCGEILLTSMDRDGTTAGYDCELLEAVCSTVEVPVIASGGAGEIAHFAEALRAGASAVLAASVFHFGKFSIRQVKEALAKDGFPMRL